MKLLKLVGLQKQRQLQTQFSFSLLTFSFLSPSISQILSLLHFYLSGLTGLKHFCAWFKEQHGLGTAASRMCG